MSDNETLQRLAKILEQRKDAKADESYVASLYESGLEKILAKISEEAGEAVEVAREEDTQHLIHEVADLWFHCMVLLAQKNVSHEDVLLELDQRFGISGLVEKAQR
jgi:phosphoribosyl-ATP pyrophosphohydrolase